MNSNQRSRDNNQTDNMANEKSVSSSRGGTTENYSKQDSSPGTGAAGGGSKQSGTKPSQGGSEQSAPYHHVPQPGEDAPEQSQGSAGMSRQSEQDAGDYQYAHGRGHKAQQSMDQDASVGSGDWEGALSRRGASRQSSQAEGSASGSQQSVGRGPGSQQSQVGGMDWQSDSELGAQQSRAGNQGAEPWIGEVRSQQSGGTPTLGGSGQGQHAQSSGGNEGSDKPPTRVAPEGAGMPAQKDVGRSAQTQPGKAGLEITGQPQGTDDLPRQGGQSRQSSRQGGSQSQPQGGGRVNESSQSQDRDAVEVRPDSSAGGAKLSGSTNSLNTDTTGRVGAQTGSEQMAQGYDDVGTQRYSNDSSGGYPRSPAGNRQSAQQDMDDDTGLSNSANMQEIDMGTKQVEQSHVGRRSDMTPD